MIFDEYFDVIIFDWSIFVFFSHPMFFPGAAGAPFGYWVLHHPRILFPVPWVAKVILGIAAWPRWDISGISSGYHGAIPLIIHSSFIHHHSSSFIIHQMPWLECLRIYTCICKISSLPCIVRHVRGTCGSSKNRWWWKPSRGAKTAGSSDLQQDHPRDRRRSDWIAM